MNDVNESFTFWNRVTGIIIIPGMVVSPRSTSVLCQVSVKLLLEALGWSGPPGERSICHSHRDPSVGIYIFLLFVMWNIPKEKYIHLFKHIFRIASTWLRKWTNSQPKDKEVYVHMDIVLLTSRMIIKKCLNHLSDTDLYRNRETGNGKYIFT